MSEDVSYTPVANDSEIELTSYSIQTDPANDDKIESTPNDFDKYDIIYKCFAAAHYIIEFTCLLLSGVAYLGRCNSGSLISPKWYIFISAMGNMLLCTVTIFAVVLWRSKQLPKSAVLFAYNLWFLFSAVMVGVGICLSITMDCSGSAHEIWLDITRVYLCIKTIQHVVHIYFGLTFNDAN